MEHSFCKRSNDETDGCEEVKCDDKGNSPIHDTTSSPSFENKETPFYKQELTSAKSATSLNDNVGSKSSII